MPGQTLVDQYRKILRSAFESATGDSDPISDELDAAALASLEASADRLASQLEHSVIDAPWTRRDLAGIVEDWISNPNDDGELNLSDLRSALEPIYGTSRSLMISRSEVAQTFNGGAAAGYRAHGWTHVVWIAADDACPDCAELDGEEMSIDQYEANPSLHPNCSCSSEPSMGEAADESDAAEA